MSFYAKYWSTNNRLEQTIELNGSHCKGLVVESKRPPEIFSHCAGSIPQSIGGKCFKCGKVLTIEDAKEYAKFPLKGIQKG